MRLLKKAFKQGRYLQMHKKLNQTSDLPENNGGEVSSESLLNAAYSVWLGRRDSN